MIIKTILDTRRSNKEGKFPVKISFANLGKTAMISLNIWVFYYEFDKEHGLLHSPDKKTMQIFQKHNSYINNEISKASNLLNSLQLEGKDLINPMRFKELLLSNKEQFNYTFNSYLKKFIENKSGRTAEIYIATLNKIEKHFGKNVYFEDINYKWLDLFDRKMQKEEFYNSAGEIIKIGLAINARSIHMRNIRSVFNNAIDNEIIGIELYPFRRYKIKKEETPKRAISVENLRKIFSFEGSIQQNWARDVSKLIFFLIGINVKDLFYLSEIHNETTSYKRAKTGRLYNIKIQPETHILLNRFSGNNGLLIFEEQFKNYHSFGAKINDYLKSICKELNITKITTYTLRHTWATIAANLEISKDIISLALGHGKKTTTDIYIDYDKNKIDKANRKVIDYTLNINHKANANNGP